MIESQQGKRREARDRQLKNKCLLPTTTNNNKSNQTKYNTQSTNNEQPTCLPCLATLRLKRKAGEEGGEVVTRAKGKRALPSRGGREGGGRQLSASLEQPHPVISIINTYLSRREQRLLP